MEELIESEKFQSKSKKACLLLKVNEFVHDESHFTLKSVPYCKGQKVTLRNSFSNIVFITMNHQILEKSNIFGYYKNSISLNIKNGRIDQMRTK